MKYEIIAFSLSTFRTADFKHTYLLLKVSIDSFRQALSLPRFPPASYRPIVLYLL